LREKFCYEIEVKNCQTDVENLRQLMKVLVANPEVAGRVAESVTVVMPVASEELVVVAVVPLYEYPAFAAGGGDIPRRRICSSISDIDRSCALIAS